MDDLRAKTRVEGLKCYNSDLTESRDRFMVSLRASKKRVEFMKKRVLNWHDEAESDYLNDADPEDFIRRFIEFEVKIWHFSSKDYEELGVFLDEVTRWVSNCWNISLIKYMTNLRDFKPCVLNIYDFQVENLSNDFELRLPILTKMIELFAEIT